MAISSFFFFSQNAGVGLTLFINWNPSSRSIIPWPSSFNTSPAFRFFPVTFLTFLRQTYTALLRWSFSRSLYFKTIEVYSHYSACLTRSTLTTVQLSNRLIKLLYKTSYKLNTGKTDFVIFIMVNIQIQSSMSFAIWPPKRPVS